MKVDKYILKAIKQLIDNPKYTVNNDEMTWLDTRELPDKTEIIKLAGNIKLNELKTSKKQEIESIYNTKSQEPIEYQLDSTHNYTFQADSKSQDILTKVIASAPEDFEIDWLDIDNNPIHLTLDELKELAGLILTRSQELFAKKVTLKKQVDSVKSKDELENIKWED